MPAREKLCSISDKNFEKHRGESFTFCDAFFDAKIMYNIVNAKLK